MAARAKSISKIETFGADGHVVVWAGLLQSSSDTGDPFECPEHSKLTLQLSGTLGSGGAVTVEGSIDGTTWGSLHDVAGSELVLDAAGEINAPAERPRHIRPRVSAGNGATDLTVTLFAKR